MIVIGGGIVGLSIAWRAAVAGLAVTLVDPAPASGASHAAAGMLAPLSEASVASRSVALGVEALERWPSFAEELARAAGRPVTVEGGGGLHVAVDHDGRRHLSHLAEVLTGRGQHAERLGAGDVRRLEPSVSPSAGAGLLVADDARVDPREVCAALLDAAVAAGVHLRRVAATGVWTDDPASRRVELADGSQLGDEVVVLATASRTVPVHGTAHPWRWPVRPVKGQILRLRHTGSEPILGRTVQGSVDGVLVYLVPRHHGEVVVGATQEERADLTVTAGAVHDLLAAAVSLVPDLAEAELAESLARLRPCTPDEVPLVGPSGVEGVLLASGHHRNGILLAPLTADAVVAHATGRTPPSVTAVADPRRFAA